MKFSKKNTLSILLFALALSALAPLLFKFQGVEFWRTLHGAIFFKSLGFTIFQGALSTFFSVAIGIIAAPGYSRLKRGRSFLRWILLLPNLMSSVLIVLCLLIAIPEFPYGIWGIVLGHVYMNSGLAILWIGERWSSVESEWAGVTKVLGSSKTLFYVKIMGPLVGSQILSCAAVIFAFSLSSFAVPLVLGGGPQASTLEVLIYELIQSQASFSGAVFISFVQSFIQLAIYIVILRESGLKITKNLKTFIKPLPRIENFLSQIPLFVAAGFLLYPLESLLRLAYVGFLKSHFSMEALFSFEFLRALILSLEVAALVFAAVFIFLALMLVGGWSKIVVRLPALSGVVVGLSGILIFKIGGNTHFATTLAALSWGHLVVNVFPVLRLAAPRLNEARLRFEKIFYVLQTPDLKKFRKVYLRLLNKELIAASGLAACWSLGEFSVARTMGFAQNTLPVYIQNLLGSYRLEEAAVSSVLLLVFTFISLAFIEVLSDGVV